MKDLAHSSKDCEISSSSVLHIGFGPAPLTPDSNIVSVDPCFSRIYSSKLKLFPRCCLLSPFDNFSSAEKPTQSQNLWPRYWLCRNRRFMPWPRSWSMESYLGWIFYTSGNVNDQIYFLFVYLTESDRRGSEWKHEHASEKMFDALILENQVSLPKTDHEFIKALISGDASRTWVTSSLELCRCETHLSFIDLMRNHSCSTLSRINEMASM